MATIIGGFHDTGHCSVEVISVQMGEGLVDCMPFNL